jgi:ABC-type antimicrobial peptide transport system permease subunit
MAVGAKARHILVQFLVEAFILSLAGGVLGVVFGVGSAHLVVAVRALAESRLASRGDWFTRFLRRCRDYFWLLPGL